MGFLGFLIILKWSGCGILYRKDIELLGKPTFDPSPGDPVDSDRRDRKMSVCVCMYVCVCVCMCTFSKHNLSCSCFSEMAEPIWTNLDSFESSREVIDQV